MTSLSRLSGILALAIAAAAWRPAAALVLRLESARDNTLYEDATGSISNGAGQHFFTGTNLVGAIRRGVLFFDVAASIPPGTVVDSVAVLLHMSRTLSGPRGVGLHRLQASWGEGSSDAALEEGGGTTATTGDATWIHRFFPAQRWTLAGGDFEAVPSAVVAVGGIGNYSWTSAALRADVQQWVDNSSINFGWMLIGVEDSLASSKRFDSHENPDPAVRPQLLVFIDPATDAGPGTGLAGAVLAVQPSPFTAVTHIAYALPRAGAAHLQVHDVRGRLVRTLFAAPAAPGRHAAIWDGRDDSGRALPAGSYFLVLDTGGARRSERVVLLRSRP